MCAICNGKAYGGGFLASPEAVPDDGWLDVFIIRKVSRLTIAKLLGLYKKGGHFAHGALTEPAKPYFLHRRAKTVTLRPVDGRGPHRSHRRRRVRPLRRRHRRHRAPRGPDHPAQRPL